MAHLRCREQLSARRHPRCPSRVRMLAELQSANISDNAPTIGNGHLSVIIRHRPRTARDHFKVVANRSVRQFHGHAAQFEAARKIAVIRRRRRESPAHDHAMSGADAVMAHGTINIEAFPAAVQVRLRQGKWKDVRIRRPVPAADEDRQGSARGSSNQRGQFGPVFRLHVSPSRGFFRIRWQLAARHGSGNQRAGRAVVFKKRTLLQRAIARLLGHLLATGRQRQRRQQKRQIGQGPPVHLSAPPRLPRARKDPPGSAWSCLCQKAGPRFRCTKKSDRGSPTQSAAR